MADTNATHEEIADCLGSIPASTELNPRIVNREEQQSYVRETIEYTVGGGERVRSYLLVPDISQSETAPGLVAIHQHASDYDIGKQEPAGLAGDEEYAYGEELVKRGFVVICPDLVCFGDRCRSEFQRVPSAPTDPELWERFVGMDHILRGSCMQAKHLGDLSAAIDVLEWHNRVDSSSLGAIGHSLGGQNSLWLAWYDNRIDVAVSSCGACLYETCQREEITHNFSYYIPGLLNFGDIDDVLAGTAPTPIYITNGTLDPVLPVDGVRELHQSVATAYQQEGVADHFQSVIFEGGHEFPREIRMEAYDWIDRWIHYDNPF